MVRRYVRGRDAAGGEGGPGEGWRELGFGWSSGDGKEIDKWQVVLEQWFSDASVMCAATRRAC